MNKILNYISDQFVFWNLKQISYGHLNLVDAQGKEYFFGNSKSFLKARLKINNPSFCFNILRQGSSGLAESYMKGEFETDDLTSLIELGAKNIIDRKELESEPKLLGKGTWDGVVDTVGGNILSNAISQTKHSGIVAACGNASGNKLNTSVIPFILRGVKLWGVDSVAISKKRKEFIWKETPKLIDFDILDNFLELLDTITRL